MTEDNKDKSVGEIIDNCVVNAKLIMQEENVGVYSFPQVWHHDDIIYHQQTIVVISRRSSKACVYFDGCLAYYLSHPSSYFYERLHSLNMLSGVGEEKKLLERQNND